MTKRKTPQIGIRWKLVAYLAVFVSVLLIVLWLFQIVFLGDVYRNIKVNQIYTAAETIKARITIANPKGNAMAQLTDTIASDDQICVLVLDDISSHGFSQMVRRCCRRASRAWNERCQFHQNQKGKVK